MAINAALTAGFKIGAICMTPESHKEYWRRKAASNGGKKPNPSTEIWHEFVDAEIAKTPNMAATSITRRIMDDMGAPKCLPEYETVYQYVAKSKKALAARATKLRVIAGGRRL